MTQAYEACRAYWMPSPLGDIALRFDGDILTGLFFAGQKYFPSMTATPAQAGVPDHVRTAQRQVDAYFAGECHAFSIPYRLDGTLFQQFVWKALAAIPYGETVSYGAIAHRLELGPGHARAVGSATGRNPISIIVPCHRVLSETGDLTGYAGGLVRKRRLLQLERNEGDPLQTELLLEVA
jgi:methylated-DNA-[protein]-cysteine S-methyltransferase